MEGQNEPTHTNTLPVIPYVLGAIYLFLFVCCLFHFATAAPFL